LSTLIANAEEKRAIYYFREKAAPVLSGSLDSSFWSRLVLQVGDSEPAVRLAIMAVGSLFEHMHHKMPGSPTKDNQAVVTGDTMLQQSHKCLDATHGATRFS
jgi:hypothetical protein